MRRYNIILTMVIEYLYKNTYTVFKTRWLWIRYQNVDGYFYSSVGSNNFSYIIYITKENLEIGYVVTTPRFVLITVLYSTFHESLIYSF